MLVGIVGPKGHGKTTLARNVKELLLPLPSFPVMLMSFAEPLKKIVCNVLFDEDWSSDKDDDLKRSTDQVSIIVDNIVDKLNVVLEANRLAPINKLDRKILSELESCQTKGELYRRGMQLIGTEVFRRRDSDFWVKQLMQRYDDLITRDDRYVVIVHDVRFPNEFIAIKDRNGLLVGILRKGHPIDKSHASELYTEGLARQAHLFRECEDLLDIDSYSVEVVRAIIRKRYEVNYESNQSVSGRQS